ncbi:MAG: class I adenylate-forming enzyme family protein, partial [Planctomycetota bacterium]
MTLVTAFLNTCKRLPEKTAVIDQNGATTFDELWREATQYAGRLSSANVSNQVGILLHNCKEFVAAFYGILMTGKTPVPLNYLLSPAQLAFVIQNADINTIFTNNL